MSLNAWIVAAWIRRVLLLPNAVRGLSLWVSMGCIFSPGCSVRAGLCIYCSLQLGLVGQQGRQGLNRVEVERSSIRNRYVRILSVTSTVIFCGDNVYTSQKTSWWIRCADRERFHKEFKSNFTKQMGNCIRITFLTFGKKTQMNKLHQNPT